MGSYERLMTMLEMLSDVLNDSISVEISIKNNVYWIGIKSVNGKSIEKRQGNTLISNDSMFTGEIETDGNLKGDVTGVLCGYEYVYDAYGDKRHEFKL